VHRYLFDIKLITSGCTIVKICKQSNFSQNIAYFCITKCITKQTFMNKIIFFLSCLFTYSIRMTEDAKLIKEYEKE